MVTNLYSYHPAVQFPPALRSVLPSFSSLLGCCFFLNHRHFIGPIWTPSWIALSSYSSASSPAKNPVYNALPAPNAIQAQLATSF